MTDPVFVGLGSNCDGAEEMLLRAEKEIASLPDVAILARSPFYRTEPQGYADQPWFTNAVIRLAVGGRWDARGLLSSLLAIESRLGRVRSKDPALRFGPRAIDLDLLLFGDRHSQDPGCRLPHPRMTERAFVLIPLRDIAPGLTIGGKTVETHLAALAWRKVGDKIFQ
ncbi:MAG: 2-amino-4-hydroxy-6-hydroxymethyldihydropteridine diphosphokinase [Desulfovibrio sp.]|nr:2-amino-4-hydroxy-6-hydroxymethyldihydropteridine diphosphokinase [Desulfovibrio sp.]